MPPAPLSVRASPCTPERRRWSSTSTPIRPAKAGIEPGDVIAAINGIRVATRRDLAEAIEPWALKAEIEVENGITGQRRILHCPEKIPPLGVILVPHGDDGLYLELREKPRWRRLLERWGRRLGLPDFPGADLTESSAGRDRESTKGTFRESTGFEEWNAWITRRPADRDHPQGEAGEAASEVARPPLMSRRPGPWQPGPQPMARPPMPPQKACGDNYATF